MKITNLHLRTGFGEPTNQNVSSMKKSPFWRFNVLLITCFLTAVSFNAKSQDLSGRDFWFTFPVVNSLAPSEGPTFFILSDYCIKDGIIEFPALNWSVKFNVQPGQYTQIAIPATIAGQVYNHTTPNKIEKKGIHISTPFPVVVYAVTYSQASVDGEVVLPTNLMGTKYVGALRAEVLSGLMRSTIVATEDATTVNVKYWKNANPGKDTSNTVKLNKGETYQISSARNFCQTEINAICFTVDGTVVSSDKPVCVVNSVDCGNTQDCGPCDNMMTMPLPVSKWDKNYTLAQSVQRNGSLTGNCSTSKNAGDWFQVIGDVGTVVKITDRFGIRNDTIKNVNWNNNANYGYGYLWGEIAPPNTTTAGNCDMLVEANAPVQVIQYQKSYSSDNKADTDPEAVVIYPTSMWKSSYLMGSLRTATTTTGFLTVVVNDVGSPLPSTTITRNGAALGGTWIPIAGTTWKYNRITVVPTTASERFSSTGNYPFAIYSGSSGAAESFSFQGGLGPILTSVCPTCPIANFSSNKNFCVGQAVTFTDKSDKNDSTTLSNIVKWKWEFGDGDSLVTTTSTNPTHTYTTGGTYEVKLTVTNNSTPVCSQTYTYKIFVSGGPVVNPGPNATICKGEKVKLGGSPTVTGGATPYTIGWTPSSSLDTATSQNPTASPTTTTTYELTVSDAAACVIKKTVEITVLARDSAYLSTGGTICLGDSFAFTVNINASGAQLYNIDLFDGTSSKKYTGLTNGSKIYVKPTSTRDFAITSLARDDNQPACFRFSSAKQTVTVKSIPTASIGMGATICEGSSYTLTVNIPTTGGPYNFSFSDGTTTTTKSGITTSPYTQVMNPTAGVTYSLTNIEYASTPKCSFNPNVTTSVVVSAKSNPGIGGNLTMCRNAASSDLNTTLTNNPDPGTWSDLGGSGILSGSQVNPSSNPGLSLGDYVYQYTVKGTAPCPDTSTTSTVTIVGPPTFSNVVDKGNCDANLTSYKVTADVIDGDPATYTSPNGNITNGKFVGTVNYATKTGYTITVDDANNCGPSSYTAFVNCGCKTSAGKMSTKKMEKCETDSIKAPLPTATASVTGDSIIYVLHEGGSTVIVKEIAHASKPNFAFQAGMIPGKTYYISSIAGPAMMPYGVDTTSDCLSIAQGTPVAWYAKPTLQFTGNQSICQQNSTTVGLTFTGAAPFGVRMNGTDYNNRLAVDQLPVSPIATTTYTIDSIYDKYCRIGASNVAPVTVTVNTPPSLKPGSTQTTCNNTASGYTLTFDIQGGDVNSYNVISGGGVINNNTYTSPFNIPNDAAFEVRIDDKNGCGPMIVTNQQTCPCITAIGALTPNNTKTCDGGRITFKNIGFTPDADDVMKYVLHTNPNDPFSPAPLLITSDTSFVRLAGMSLSTTYYVTAIIGNQGPGGNPDATDRCFQKSNTVAISWDPNPTAAFSLNSPICDGSSSTLFISPSFSGTFTLDYTAAGTPKQANLSPGNLNIPVTPNVTTVYQLTRITNTANGCFSNLSQVDSVVVKPKPLLTFSAVDDTICENGVSRLKLNFTGSPQFSYTIVGPAGNVNGTSEPFTKTTTVTTPVGRSVFRITNFKDAACPAIITDSVVIIRHANPKGVITSPPSICKGTPLNIKFNFTVGTGPFNVEYRYGSKTVTRTGIPNGYTENIPDYVLGNNSFTFNLITDQATGCASGAQLPTPTTIVRDLPTADLMGSKTVCLGESVDFEATATGIYPIKLNISSDESPAETLILDSLNAGTGQFTMHPAGIGTVKYRITSVTDAYCANIGGTESQVTVMSSPNADFSLQNVDGCVPITTTFTNLSQSTESLSCTWRINGKVVDNADCNSFDQFFGNVGHYEVSLQVSTPTGCSATKDGLAVDVRPYPKADFTFDPENPTYTNSLVHFSNESSFGHTWDWTFDTLGKSNQKNPYFQFPDDHEATYSIKLVSTSQYGCADSIVKTVSISGEMFIYIPNSFSPNGDGTNDEFKPVINGLAEDVKGFEMFIFNRWGEQMFHTTDPGKGWDGAFKGTAVSQDVYVYKIKVRSKYDAEAREISGKIAIVK